MSVQYRAVGWNRQKRIYDSVLGGGLVVYLAIFYGLGAVLHPNATAETLVIRGLGTAAFLLLHFVLCIGPLCRLDARFLPLLYNRRHLGVTTFLLGLGHGAFATFQFHALGDTNPILSIFTANQRFTSFSDFPFQPFGFFALVILFVMAATSHDFWLQTLSSRSWKRIHMLVYVAYAMLVAHVALGALQSEKKPVFAVLLISGVVTVLALHLAAGVKEYRFDRQAATLAKNGFIPACAVDQIPEDRAVVIPLAEERIAIFRYAGKVSAVSNVCRHQLGPLGEGKIINGCITCPWHGYQYLPQDGTSPPPFKEKIATYRTRIFDGRVWVDTRPNPPGTFVQPSEILVKEVIR